MKRIINKHTGIFIRDDFTFDEETEIGLEVAPAQGLYQPKWDGSQWIEGASQEYIDCLTNPVEVVPTLEERLSTVELEQDAIVSVLSDILGV